MLRLDNRDNARIVEMCYKTHTTLVNPIIDWTEAEVWEFIHEYNVPYCELYDQGYKRLGCIGCPMSGGKGMVKELNAYPKYKALYLKAFEKMLQHNKEKGVKCSWNSPEEVMEWWVNVNNNNGNEADTEIMELLEDE